jgi:predicted nucleotide-binding protein
LYQENALARRPTSPPPLQPARLTEAQIHSGIDRLKRRIEDVRAFDPQTVRDQHQDPHVTALQASIDDTLVKVFGANTLEYERYSPAATFDTGPVFMQRDTHPQEILEALDRSKRHSISLLEQAVRSLEEEIDHLASPQGPSPGSQTGKVAGSARKGFVVHGHDDGARETIARFLEKIDFQAVILHERPNKGRTIITKFREEAADIGFAIVLMTADDHGAKVGEPTRPRARQNVVFELGFFIGALGPERVVAMLKGDVERPSDFEGVVYISLDDSDWRAALGRELEAIGFAIDWNKVMRG